MKWFRFLQSVGWGAAALGALAACTVQLVAPDEVFISCSTIADCPAGMACRTHIGRCVPADAEDAAPEISQVSVSHERVAQGTTLTVTFTVNEPLHTPPVLLLNGSAEVSFTLGERHTQEEPYIFTRLIDGTEPEGDGLGLAAVLVDVYGNQATRQLGSVDIDFTPPELYDLGWQPAHKTHVRGDDVVQVVGSAELGAQLQAAYLIHITGEVLLDITSQLSLTETSVNTTLGASINLAPLDLTSAVAIGVEVWLVDAVGNLRDPTTSRTPFLTVDLVPPAAPQVSVDEGPLVSSTEIHVTLVGPSDAVEVEVYGNHLTKGVSRQPVTGLEAGVTFPVTLREGDGSKIIEARVYDAAGNASPPAQGETYLSTAAPLADPRIIPPSPQTAVKNGDVITVGGGSEPGAQVVSVRLVHESGVGEFNEVETYAPGDVSIDALGKFSGTLTLSNLTHGMSLRLEIQVKARGQISTPEDSRGTSAVMVDLLPPPAPPAASLLLREESPAPYDPSQADPSFNTMTLSGAAPEAAQVRVFSEPALLTEVAMIPVNGGSFTATILPFQADKTYHVQSIDHAGNVSAGTTVTVPKVTGVTLSPPIAKDGAQVTIELAVDTRLEAPPVVTVGHVTRVAQHTGGNHQAPTTYTYTYTVQEGVDLAGLEATLVRVTMAADPADFGAGTTGTAAVPLPIDFTPPALAAAQVVVRQNDPGTPDAVEGLSGAVSDAAGADHLNLGTWPVQVHVIAQGESCNNLEGTPTASIQAGGAFAPIAIGDNTQPAVRLCLVDHAGNVAETSPVFHNDIAPPQITGLQVTPHPARGGNTLNATFTLEDNASPLREPPQVRLGAANLTLVSGDLNVAGAAKSFEYNILLEASSASYTEGWESITVSAVDQVGNDTGAATTVLLDFTPPTAVCTVPGGQSPWHGEPAISGAAQDNLTGVAAVEVAVRHDGSGLYWDGTTFAAGAPAWHLASGTNPWTYQGVGPGVFTTGQTYTVQWRATDEVGNTSSPGAHVFVFDESAIMGPASVDAWVPEVGEILVEWTPVPQHPDLLGYNLYYAPTGSLPPYNGTGAAQGSSPIFLPTSETELLLSGLPLGHYDFYITSVYQPPLGESFPTGPATAASERWLWREPPTTSHTIQSITSPEAGVFVLVGQGGLIARSEDNGVTWSVKPSGITGGLHGVWGEGEQIIAAGDLGVILRSMDGGETWTAVSSGTASHLTAVWGTDNNVVVVGSGIILRSTDGGATWTSTFSNPTSSFTAVWGTESAIVAVGSQGVARRSTDGGASWTATSSFTSNDLRGVWGSQDTFVAVGPSGTVYRSTNAGSGWSPVTTSTPVLSALWGQGSMLLATAGGGVWRSTNTGQSWQEIVDYSTTVNVATRAVTGNGSAAIAGGTWGALLRSTNQGAAWDTVNATLQSLHGVWDDGTTAVAVGNRGTILHRAHGGDTWSARASGTTTPLSAVWGQAGTFVVVGSSGTVRRSTDGGQTWSTITSGTTRHLNGVWGRDNLVIAVGTSGAIHRSTDGGQAWSAISTSGSSLSSVWGENDLVIAVGNNGTIRRSVNGGVDWSTVSSGTNNTLNHVWGEGDLVIAVGLSGTILRSTDAGESWSAVTSGTGSSLNGVWGAGAVVYAAGAGGTLLRSFNGGQTWAPTPAESYLPAQAPTSTLSAIHGAPGREALLVGYNGAILKLSPP